MAKLRAALAQLAEKLGLNQKLLERAQRRYKANRKRAYVAHNQQIKAQKRADEYLHYNAKTNVAKGEHFIKAANRHAAVAYKNHLRAQYWLGVIKKLTQRIEGISTKKADLEALVKKLDKVSIVRNHASGGDKHERLKAVALASASACAGSFTDDGGEDIHRPNFYSQLGSFDADHCITGPAYGHRDDCSSWFASAYRSAGLEDPSGQSFAAGWTGTLVEHGTQISQPEIGCAVIYGSGSGHHVEMYVGPGSKTIGHGSAPVDAGTIDLFGDGDFRYFKYI